MLPAGLGVAHRKFKRGVSAPLLHRAPLSTEGRRYLVGIVGGSSA